MTSVFYIGSLLTMIIFTATLKINIYMLFGTISLLGFFMSGYLPVGFELATEVTYPEPEGLSCGLLNSSAQVRLYDYIIWNFADFSELMFGFF